MPSTTPSVLLKPPFRWAKPEDCYDIAELFSISSGGVADYVWSTLGIPDLSLLEIGEQRYAREDTEFSYQNCVVAEIDDELAGMMVSFQIEKSEAEPAGPAASAGGEPDVLAPYRDLEVPGSYYICGVALLPRYQGQGLGTRMCEIAKNLARARNCGELSLLVFEQNMGAVRLYERLGFKEIDRRAVVPHELIRYTGDVLLMTTPVAVGAGGR
ncbi:MAG TPA: GNAT family N-acetyltransferase [Kiloniellales bacterium]|jgi:ribosomal protein S18 acetylase RimI-like enzyme